MLRYEEPVAAALALPHAHGTPPRNGALERPRALGKFLFVGDDKFYVRGVTYGTFRTDSDGRECLDPPAVARDFAAMAASGINAVRVYTVPPVWLLDLALDHGLRVMVGLPWEQHVAFLDEPATGDSIERRVRADVRACERHPAVLCFAIGNEIPASIVRWHGRRRVQRFLKRLYRAVKEEDPGALVTYVNFPSTEYLDLPFLDFLCFNVYLEDRESLEAYLARLQVLAGDRALVMAEIGLDSRRNGTQAQASVLGWQVRSVFASGCAGAFVFAWTDEWHRGGHAIDDWDFGLTDRERRPKPALPAVRAALAAVPFSPDLSWPRVSVVVCSFNGARTIRDCCEGLARLDYPDFEVIVVDDGSTDGTAGIAAGYGFRVVSTENRGLSSARNLGMELATGAIVAYTDDDARPDPHWLTYLAATFMATDHAAVGGPNIAPDGDGPIAHCVANAPGGPMHVLLSDTVAEHIPGCNMAFRRECLLAIGGFDARYRAAGDDVDVCWRLQERGWTIGFSPAAMVWHHRRNSVRAYWKQQQGYGKAEALLEAKWPEKYNTVGHLTWGGRIYGNGLTRALTSWRGRVYQGAGGFAPFQSVYEPAPGLVGSLPLMPEWYFVIAALALASAAAFLWAPLLWALPLLGLAVAAPVVQAYVSAARSPLPPAARSLGARARIVALTTVLHLLQPAARLRGRLRHGLTPWRRRAPGLAPIRPRTSTAWSERWRSPEEWLGLAKSVLGEAGAVVYHGGDFDRWDLQVRGGILGAARLRVAVEEHGSGRQLARIRSWPRFSPAGLALCAVLAALSGFAGADGSPGAAVMLGLGASLVGARALLEAASALGAVRAASEALRGLHSEPDPARRAAASPEASRRRTHVRELGTAPAARGAAAGRLE